MFFNQKFEPKGDKILHGAGQSSETFSRYLNVVGKYKPVIYMTYNKINDVQEKLPKKINEMLKFDKRLYLQLGLNLKPKGETEKCKEILQGKYDNEILSLIKLLKELKNPVFLRIGYEFNNPTHNYNSEEFILAWKYIVDLFRTHKVKNVAFVWNCCTAFNRDINEIMKYYPGDDYVDWFSNNFFGVRHFANNQSKVTEEFAKESENHKKPLMIGECSAARVGVLKGKESWDEWFKPFFDWIKSHEVVKAFCYINWDWGIDWKQPEWGNCRIEDNEVVSREYAKELSNNRYVCLED